MTPRTRRRAKVPGRRARKDGRARPRHDRADRGAVAELAGAVEHRADLGDPGLGELAVVLAVVSPKKGDTLQPEQVSQGVLVDHLSMLRALHRAGYWISGRTTRINLARDLDENRIPRSPCHWRAINDGHKRRRAATTGHTNWQVRPHDGVFRSDSQADSAGSVPVTRSNHGGPGQGTSSSLGLDQFGAVVSIFRATNVTSSPEGRAGRLVSCPGT